ncbi:hypothetical protein [Streptomyces anandii]|nr:hypothetical protein [Streptomyces anandii]GGX94594.1 hypothetical protein GCM10010510_44740 [Streptomyces anandii JCM 4720]
MPDFTQFEDAVTALTALDDAELSVGTLRVLLDQLGEVLGLAEAGQ